MHTASSEVSPRFPPADRRTAATSEFHACLQLEGARRAQDVADLVEGHRIGWRYAGSTVIHFVVGIVRIVEYVQQIQPHVQCERVAEIDVLGDLQIQLAEAESVRRSCRYRSAT